MKWAMYSVSSLALSAISNQALAADGSINITGNQNSIYIASDNVSGSSFDNLSITSSTATFKKDLIGTQNKNVTNQTLSFSGKMRLDNFNSARTCFRMLSLSKFNCSSSILNISSSDSCFIFRLSQIRNQKIFSLTS